MTSTSDRWWLTPLLLLIAVAPVDGQSFHLPPWIAPTVPNQTLLLIEAPATAAHAFTERATVRIYGGRMWLFLTDGTSDVVDLDGSTIEQVRDKIRSKYPGVSVTSSFLEYDARYLDEFFPRRADSLAIYAGLGGPDLISSFGVLFGLTDFEDRENAQLFGSGGVRLDLGAGHRMSPRTSIRARMAYASSEPVQKAENSDATSTSGAAPGTPITTIIEGAERFALSLHLDGQLTTSTTKPVLTFGLEAEIAWEGFAPERAPTEVAVGDSTVSTETLFGAQRVREVETLVNQIGPSAGLLTNLGVRFPTRRGITTYATFGAGLAQLRTRAFALETITDPTDVSSEDISGSVDSSWQGVWRIGFGLDVASAVNIRADAIGPLASAIQPLLRLMVIKEVPII